MCGSPSGMVGVGRSTCAGGGAYRRQGVWPIQGTIDQSNGSESFTRDQGRCVREELKNGSPDCSVYARRRAAEVRRGYRRRDCSGEVVEDVGEVLRVTTMCGSPSGMVGVGRSTCAGGGAYRRQGVWPIQGTIDQSNGSESFTRDQGRCVREELKNGSPDCSVYARRRAAEVRRGRSLVSGEVLPGPSAWKASQTTGEANRGADTAWTRL